MSGVRRVQKVDEGWAWVVVGGSFLNHFLFEGMVRSYGLIYLALLDRFHGNAAFTAWIQATFNAVAMATGPLTSIIAERYSCRVLVVTSGVLLCTALLLSSFSPNLYFLYFSYSLVGGIAGSFVYSPMVVVVSLYFDKKRGRAMGLAALGGAVGTAAMPPLVGYLLDLYGYSGCLTVMAAVCLHHCISGLLYRPLAAPDVSREGSVVCTQSVLYPSQENKFRSERLFSSVTLLNRDKIDSETASYCSLRVLAPMENPALSDARSLDATKRENSFDQLLANKVKQRTDPATNDPNECTNRAENSDQTNCLGIRRKIYTNVSPRLEILANVSFLLFCFNLFNIPTTLISTFIFLPGLGEEFGLLGSQTALLISIIGISSGVGRLFFGFVFDLAPVSSRRRLLHSVLGVLLGVSTTSLVMCRHFLPLAIVCSCIGLSEGGVVAQRATALSQYVRPQQLVFAFGIMTMFQGFGNLIGPLLQGYLKDRLGSYIACFCYGGGVTILSSGLLIVDYFFKTRKTS